ncbi:putative membrane protein [Micromonospora pisi]|uniref:Putative membrane protein n=2 Tax=Micromonospora pisi TaxID=589240 RepID=A0A495JA85_9ACTN|nr:putative membrane protein [Micromonospora pisi]
MMGAAAACGAIPVGLYDAAVLGPLVGWDCAALFYLAWARSRLWPLNPDETARFALRADSNRGLRDSLLLFACLASLLAIGVVLIRAKPLDGFPEQLHIALGIVSVLFSWAVIHTVFAGRYARLYYTGTDGGVRFNRQSPPRYTDFAYLAFTLGMTFQVSDTPLSSPAIRRTALRHALLSYLFGAVIIASTVNLIAGLAR